MQTQTIGILGLGLVGQALATRLKSCGYAAAGYDPSPQAASAAAAAGVQLVDGAATLAAHCEVLLICVLDDDALIACATSLGAAPGNVQLVVSCVTASVKATATVAEALARTGTRFADMPLLGSSRQIAEGEALGLLGMDTTDAKRHAAVLAVLCPRYRRVGPPGHGVRAKLACNLVLGLNRAALAEGLALATSLGLEGTTFLDLLRVSPAYSKAVDIAGPRMIAGDFRPLSRIRQHRKDLTLILEQGKEAELDLSLTSAHASLLDKAISQGLGELDNVAIITAIRPPVTGQSPRNTS